MSEEELKQFTDMQSQLADLIKSSKENNETITTLKNKNEELTKVNNKLFLSITSNEGTKEENDNNEYKEYVGEKFWNELSPKEQEKLKIILQGEDE